MELTTDDTFKTKEELIDRITEYAASLHFKFYISETPRTLSFVCKGKQEFNCDACIVTCYKKKDNCFSIKRIKLTHKCPIANTEYTSTDEFLKNEIYNNIADYSNIRIGEIAAILYNRGIRVSYSSIYYILHGQNMKKQEFNISSYKPTRSIFFRDPLECQRKTKGVINSKMNKTVSNIKFKDSLGNRSDNNIRSSNDENSNESYNDKHEEPGDNKIKKMKYTHEEKMKYTHEDIFPTKNETKVIEQTEAQDYGFMKCFDRESFKTFNELNYVIDEFCNELTKINNNKLEVFYWGKMIFYKIRDYIDILYPVIEIKYFKRKTGIVIYGVLYDPIDEPIIYTCLVSDDICDEEAFEYFLYNTNHNQYIIEYDMALIQILNKLNIDFFIKTRDLCKFVYSKNGNRENLVNVWNICNSINEDVECDGGSMKCDGGMECGSDMGTNTKGNTECKMEGSEREQTMIENKENIINAHIKNTSNNKATDGQATDRQVSDKQSASCIAKILNVDESKFVRSKSKINLLNINNLHECDIDFVSYGVYSLSFLECVNAIIKLSADNLKIKKRFIRQDVKSLFGYNVINRIERNSSMTPKEKCVVNLEKATCECGAFQKVLIPCVHACIFIREQRLDPYMYVSKLYSKEQYSKLEDILPVMNVGVKVLSDKFFFKKGPGRPKKSLGKEQ